MMKKTLLLSAASVAGAAALVGGMTIAAFNDTEVQQWPAAVAAGTLELDQQGITQPAWVTNMKPGDVADFTIDLQNEGTLDGHLYAALNNVVGFEDGCDVRDGMFDPARVESMVDSNCWDRMSGGDLVQYLDIAVVTPSGDVYPIVGSAEVDLGALPADTADDYILRVTFHDPGAGDKWVIDPQNAAQGDGATIQLKFALTAA